MSPILNLVRGATLAALLLGVAPEPRLLAQAQRPGQRPVCDGGLINAWRVADLDGGPQGLEAAPASAILLRAGGLVVAPWRTDRPLELLPMNSEQRRTLMRVGEGPGEIKRVGVISRGIADSLLVFDPMLLRLSILTPAGHFARQVRLEVSTQITSIVQLAGSQFVVAANIPTRSRAGLPIHLVSATGTIVRSFGGDQSGATRLLTAEDALRMERILVAASDSTVYAIRPGEYVVEQWALDGRLMGSWDLAAPWFSPKNRVMAESHAEPPPPRVVDAQLDAAGRLWVISWRAAEAWRKGVAPAARPPARFTLLSLDDYVDSQVDVYDLPTMERVAQGRCSLAFGRFVAAGVALHADAQRDGEPLARLYRLASIGGTIQRSPASSNLLIQEVAR
jgi:hypothetical protein